MIVDKRFLSTWILATADYLDSHLLRKSKGNTEYATEIAAVLTFTPNGLQMAVE